jgi:uncharacterized membrane protein YdbT with pleckstrin-like domain
MTDLAATPAGEGAGRRPEASGPPADALGLRLPHRNLLLYYVLQSLLLGPFFPVLLLPRIFKYRSLRYRFDDGGVAAEWGVLFRHEVSLSYSRIQDLHLASNLLERWLGLARIQVQTASGSSTAEMTIEGLPDYAEVRDWLYSRMRGATRRAAVPADAAVATTADGTLAPDAAVEALHQATAELRRVRELLERSAASGAPRSDGPGALP